MDRHHLANYSLPSFVQYCNSLYKIMPVLCFFFFFFPIKGLQWKHLFIREFIGSIQERQLHHQMEMSNSITSKPYTSKLVGPSPQSNGDN